MRPFNDRKLVYCQSMKAVTVPFLEKVARYATTDELLVAMGALEAIKLTEVPWADFPYCPSVHFKIAHTVVGIVLLYDVKEKHMKSVYRRTNDPVYKDSCVEFFLSFDGVNYYNLEFNCLGTGLIGYGPAEKSARKRLNVETIEQVKTYSRMSQGTPENGDKAWQLLLQIPLSVFEAHTIDSLAGRRCTGNFYKCGDDLPEPHYVAWNPINHPTPNFHLPQYFGELVFE